MPLGHCDAFGKPVEGSLWEYDDEVYRVEKVYSASKHDGKGGFEPTTLVKVVCVEPAPRHCPIGRFLDGYAPYDPEAE